MVERTLGMRSTFLVDFQVDNTLSFSLGAMVYYRFLELIYLA